MTFAANPKRPPNPWEVRDALRQLIVNEIAILMVNGRKTLAVSGRRFAQASRDLLVSLVVAAPELRPASKPGAD